MFGLTPYNDRRNRGLIGRNRDPFDIINVFENFFNDSFFPSFFNNSSYMRVDIKENDKEYVLEAELPGVEKDEINLEVRDDLLTISVNHREDTQEERENYIRRERRVSSMSRSFQLDNVRQEAITAKFENGILSVKLPKIQEGRARTRTINIQ